MSTKPCRPGLVLNAQRALAGVLVGGGVNLETLCVALTTPSALIHNELQIVALNVEQFGPSYPGEYCGKKIAIWVGVESAVATIVDKVRPILVSPHALAFRTFGTQCMGCPWAGLDFSVGLFTHFAAESVGVLQGVWYFLD